MPSDDHLTDLAEPFQGCPPALLIEIEFEATPRLTFFSESNEDMDRLLDWVNSCQRRVDLVALALELGAGSCPESWN